MVSALNLARITGRTLVSRDPGVEAGRKGQQLTKLWPKTSRWLRFAEVLSMVCYTCGSVAVLGATPKQYTAFDPSARCKCS